MVRVEAETRWSGWPSSTRSTSKGGKKRGSSEANVSFAELHAAPIAAFGPVEGPTAVFGTPLV